jgi:hypothetical protein
MLGRRSPREELKLDPQRPLLAAADVADEHWLRVWFTPFDLRLLREIDRASV